MTTDTKALNPWFSMWTRPRDTIQQIVSAEPERYVYALAAVAGISQALDRASMGNAGDKLELTYILLIAAVAGPMGGIISVYIFGAFLRWTGSWLGGKASSAEVRAALAWSSIPMIFALALWVPELLIFGKDLFSSVTPQIDSSPLTYLAFTIAEVIIGVWTVVIFLKSLGQVHGFSAWRVLGSTLLGGLVSLVSIVLLAILVKGISGSL